MRRPVQFRPVPALLQRQSRGQFARCGRCDHAMPIQPQRPVRRDVERRARRMSTARRPSGRRHHQPRLIVSAVQPWIFTLEQAAVRQRKNPMSKHAHAVEQEAENVVLTDVKTLRDRAQKSLDKGAVTPSCGGEVAQSIDLLQTVRAALHPAFDRRDGHQQQERRCRIRRARKDEQRHMMMAANRESTSSAAVRTSIPEDPRRVLRRCQSAWRSRRPTVRLPWLYLQTAESDEPARAAVL